jgi:hypothetical protein
MRKFVRSLRLIIPMCPLVAMFFMSPVRAEGRIVVDEPTDFWLEFGDATQFLAETFQSGDLPSDPQLWLYDQNDVLIVTNDDFLGLQSKIDVAIPAGSYRLRASTCCHEPDVWRDGVVWNIRYELSFNGSQSNPVTTIEPDATTTTEVTNETTTTVEETTTTTDSPTTSSSTSTTSSTVPSSTTSSSVAVPTTVEVTTSTSEPDATTTTEPETTTSSVLVPITEVATTTSSTSVAPIVQTTTTELISDLVTTTVQPDATDVDNPVDSLPPDEVTEPDSPLITDDFTDVSVEEIVAELAVDKLETLTDEEVVALIDGIAEADLTDEQADAIAVALSDAPDDVKEEFESQVDVFSGQFDSYVALDSLISVGKRRVVIAATATALVLPASASSSGGSRKGKK